MMAANVWHEDNGLSSAISEYQSDRAESLVRGIPTTSRDNEFHIDDKSATKHNRRSKDTAQTEEQDIAHRAIIKLFLGSLLSNHRQVVGENAFFASEYQIQIITKIVTRKHSRPADKGSCSWSKELVSPLGLGTQDLVKGPSL